jgi:hypothetical protein
MEVILARTVRVFDFDMQAGGACVVAQRSPLSSGCMCDEEVDGQIDALKADLDVVSKRMKKAIRDRRNKPLFNH